MINQDLLSLVYCLLNLNGQLNWSLMSNQDKFSLLLMEFKWTI